MQNRQYERKPHPAGCTAQHSKWPENAHLQCYEEVHGATHAARLMGSFAPGARVCVAGRYVAGGFTEPTRLSGQMGTVTGQVGTQVWVVLDARDFDDDVEELGAAALDLVPQAV